MGRGRSPLRESEDQVSAYSGRQARGAARIRKELKKEEAEARNLLTDPKRRKAYRLDPANKLLVDVFAEGDA